MNPGLVVKLRPAGPWRIGPDSGARNRVDSVYHSDSLFSAVTSAMARLGSAGEWLEATAGAGASAVSFGSCFPFVDQIELVPPPRTVWPPPAPGAAPARVRWKSARFVPLEVVRAILARRRLDENQWSVDGPSQCLVPAGCPGPFRTAIRWSAAVDRLSGSAERHSTACLEFRPGAGLWTVVSFLDDAARDRWMEPVKACFRLLADSGFGGERSRGWGRAHAPEFREGTLPELILPSEPERLTAEVRGSRRALALEMIARPAEQPAVATAASEVPVSGADTPGVPAEEPPAGEPPISEPPSPEAPVSEPPAPQPEPADTAASEVPVSGGGTPGVLAEEPPTGEPSISEPPVTEAPVSEPPAPQLEPAGTAATEENTVTSGALVEEPPSPEAPVSEPPAPQPEPADTAASEVPVSGGGTPGVPAEEPPVGEPPIAEPPAPKVLISEPPASQPEPADTAASEENASVTGAPGVPVEEPPAPQPEPAGAAASEAATPEENASGSGTSGAPAKEPPVSEPPSVPAVALPAEMVLLSAEESPVAEFHRPQPATGPRYWLLSLFAPAPSDAVDWSRGSYTILECGGRVESPARSGELKKQLRMVAEGSVVCAAAEPRGSAPDVAPDGFPHPVFRAGFALAIRLPEVN